MRSGKKHDTQRLPTLIILILLLSWPIEALNPDQPAAQYLVDNWDTDKGLPANSVASLCQTPDGYLWLATEKGLARFDGIKFSVIPFFQKKKTDPLKTINPDFLFLDKFDILWIATAEGLISYDYKTGQFKTFTHADGLQDEKIRRIGCDMSGNLWISYWVNGVARFSNGTFIFFAAAQGLTGKSINAIIEDQKGNLLCGARDKGVFIFKDGRFFPYPLKELENLQVIDMKEDRKGSLWIGTTQGLFKIVGPDIARYTAGSGLSDDNVRVILEDSERNIWVGTDKGLNRFKYIDGGNITTFEKFLLSSKVQALFEDREKNLWVGTNNEDLKQIKDSKFVAYKPLDSYKDEIILSLFEDRDKNTWIGTIAGKLLRLRGSESIEVQEPRELKGTGIAAIAEDAEGNLWLGTIDNGVFQKRNGIYIHYTTANGLSNNTVTSIFKDSKDDLWFGTSAGVTVFRYKNRVMETFTSENGLSGKVVSAIIEVPQEASLALRQRKIPGAPISAPKDGPKDLLRVPAPRGIWIGADRGITVLKGGKTGKENAVHYLEGVFVSCIYEDPEAPGVYWIATKGNGLIRLIVKGGNLISTTSYTTAAGMSTDCIYQFIEDWSGNFWMMSDTGILRVGKAGLNSAADTNAGKVDCVYFDESDGLADREFNNELSRQSILKRSEGELWFNTKKGISVVNPGKIRVNKSPPPVIIETISVDRQMFPMEKGRRSYQFKSIENLGIYFTAPAFLSPRKVKFKYRLEGFDREWVFLPPGKERAAHYRDLGPGTYTFRVTASNAEGVWNQTGASITFTLEPFFYQTFLFKIVVFLLFVGFLAAAVYIYKQRPFDKRKKYKDFPLNPQFAEVCIRRLHHMVEKEKIYRDAGITLQSLAEKLSIQPYQLSQLLNEKMHQGFSDFINSNRIKEAKKLLASSTGAVGKNTTVAYEVGFNSMTAFYKAFKKFTGMTPNRYKKETR